MGKVIKLFNEQEAQQEALVKHIEELLEAAKKGDIKNIMVAAEQQSGEIATGYCNVDIVGRQYMVSAIQVDINFGIVKVNADQLIEFIEE